MQVSISLEVNNEINYIIISYRVHIARIDVYRKVNILKNMGRGTDHSKLDN